MFLSEEDRFLVKNLYIYKGYDAKRLIKEFPAKGWKKSTLNYFLKRLKETGSISHRARSGRPKTTRTQENIDTVNELILSQEGAPQTHRTVCQISRETGIHRSSVERIIKGDLQLKCVKKHRAQMLMEANCITHLNHDKQLLRN